MSTKEQERALIQSAMERYIAKGNEIKRIGNTRPTYTKKEWDAIVRGESVIRIELRAA